ncbi:MAG TPA: hypothetical protein VNU19_07110 [Candidatus Acidoferrum sp.]|jgi:hypothetical protein|nr:hypothetical protein [Candidatus Acidoferrum sp.]
MANSVRGVRSPAPAGSYVGRPTGTGPGVATFQPLPNPYLQTPQAGVGISANGQVVSIKPSGVSAATYQGSTTAFTINAEGQVTGTSATGSTPITGTITVDITGDGTASGTGAGASPTISLTLGLATVNSDTGTINGVTTNGKGLVTANVNQNYLTGNQTVTLSGYVTGSGTTAIAATVVKVQGVADASNATAGDVGEDMVASVAFGSAIGMTTNTITTVTTLSLTAGDWDVWATLGFAPAGSTVLSRQSGGLSLSSGGLPSADTGGRVDVFATYPAGDGAIFSLGTLRVNVSTTTNVYLTAYGTFTVSTCGAYGRLEARRRR